MELQNPFSKIMFIFPAFLSSGAVEAHDPVSRVQHTSLIVVAVLHVVAIAGLLQLAPAYKVQSEQSPFLISLISPPEPNEVVKPVPTIVSPHKSLPKFDPKPQFKI